MLAVNKRRRVKAAVSRDKSDISQALTGNLICHPIPSSSASASNPDACYQYLLVLDVKLEFAAGACNSLLCPNVHAPEASRI